VLKPEKRGAAVVSALSVTYHVHSTTRRVIFYDLTPLAGASEGRTYCRPIRGEIVPTSRDIANHATVNINFHLFLTSSQTGAGALGGQLPWN
jgi:hypothetical protein